MRPLLLGLHGYTMNGALLRKACTGVFAPLAEHADIVCPDAPHTCTPEAVRAAYEAWGIAPPAPPHLTWWRASDDGKQYAGWDVACERIRAALPEGVPFGLFGFSQGAMVASTLAALAARAVFPAPRFVVLVAGGPPRADDLRPLFESPLDLPSLHVWGLRDQRAATHSPKLAEAFRSERRRVIQWRGSHMVPPGGEPARAIADFMLEQLGLAGENDAGASA